MTPRRSKIAAQLGKGDARDQQTRENPKRQRSTPFTDPMATETLNRRRRDLVNELQRSYFPMNANSNALAVVLVSGDKRSSEHDWAAICVDIDEHRDAKVLALKEDIGKEDATDDKGIPLTISENARVEEIDSRAIMDYLVFDRGYIEEGEEEENVGKCALETAIDERYGAPTLKKKYRLNEEKVKRTTQMKKAVMNVRDWGLKEGEESRKFFPIGFGSEDEEQDEEEITPNAFVGNDDVDNNNNQYHSDEEDIVGTTMCAKRRRGHTPASTRVKVIDAYQVPQSGLRTTLPFSLREGMDDDDDKTLSPFYIHGKRQSEGEWQGGEVYLCDKLRRNPALARLSISRLAAEKICRELSKDKNKVVSPVDEEEEEEEDNGEETPRDDQKKKRKLGRNFPLVQTVERG